VAVWRYPFRVVRRVVDKAYLQRAQVVETEDSEGDPYFIARATTTDGAQIGLRESHDRADRELACARFNEMVFDGHSSAGSRSQSRPDA
jgi:hypothetical protein